MNKIISVLCIIVSCYSTVYSQNTLADTIQVNNKQDSVIANKKSAVIASEKDWAKFLKKNINYDIGVFNGSPEGEYIVKVRFTVFEDGTVGNVVALTRYGYGMEKEVVRVIKKSPKWAPTIKDGKPVAVTRIQEMSFTVVESE